MKADLVQEFTTLLQTEAAELGVSLGAAADEVAIYTEERLTHLASIVGEPGYMEAVKAEQDNILLFALARSIDEADAADARLMGIVRGSLAIGVRALVMAG